MNGADKQAFIVQELIDTLDAVLKLFDIGIRELERLENARDDKPVDFLDSKKPT